MKCFLSSLPSVFWDIKVFFNVPICFHINPSLFWDYCLFLLQVSEANPRNDMSYFCSKGFETTWKFAHGLTKRRKNTFQIPEVYIANH